MKKKILIIEDEEKIARFIELELSHEGYDIDKAFNGRQGLEMVESDHFDLVLLDIMLPELSGLEVLRRIRLFSDIPVIMLTARDKEQKLTADKLVLDISSHTVTYDDEEIELTNKEFLLLKTLLENKSIVLSRDTLLEKVWGYDYMGETNVVDVYIYYLRNKIHARSDEKIIETVRGAGYVIK